MSTRISLLTLTEYEQIVSTEHLAEGLAGFSCPLNKDVEDYLKNPDRATNAAHMSSSVTYLAMDTQTGEMLGYFTLMMKAYSVEAEQLSAKNRHLIKRFSQIGKDGKFVVPVFLIAQLGKNFGIPKEHQVKGSELLSLALFLLRSAKKVLGGKLVMIEREANRAKLLEFYNKNGFKSWTRRTNDNDGIEFDQMFAVLDDASVK